MKVTVLLGSPRLEGNTNSITNIFMEQVRENGHEVSVFNTYSMKIGPCYACRKCQKDWSGANCFQQDDMVGIYDSVLASDLLVCSSPIYGWFCTAPMKMALDRLIYGMCKYYGEEKGPSLAKDKGIAIITTCGYPPEKGAYVWDEGMGRYAKHLQMNYLGMYAERHMGYETEFLDEEKIARAKAFANQLCPKVNEK